MLEPTIRVCFTENCSKIKIYDTTDAYTTDNTGGYSVANGMPDDMSSAIVEYTIPNGSIDTIDVTTTLNAQTVVSGEFLVGTIDLTTTEDGEYFFTYTLVDDTGVNDVTFEFELTIFSLCNARCCVDKLWSKGAQNIINKEDCGCSGSKDSYLEKAAKAGSLFKAIKYGIACNNTVAKNEILKKLQRICKLEKCNCN